MSDKILVSDPTHFLVPYIINEWGEQNVGIMERRSPDDPLRLSVGGKQMAILQPGQATPTDFEGLIIRTGHIVGTGMTGLPMRMAAAIKRSLYHHIKESEARISVIHALDVARLTRLLASIESEVNVTDGIDPTMHDFAEALSRRLNHKRIDTLTQRKAWWVHLATPLIGGLSHQDLHKVQEGWTMPTQKIEGFTPINVVDYLNNHQYGPDDV